MKLPSLDIKSFCFALIAASLLSACGGGGDGGSRTASGGGDTPPAGNPNGNPPPTGEPPPTGNNPPPDNTGGDVPLPDPVSSPMTMSCIDGTDYQCSGGSIIRIDNGVALTSSGVQAYGKSTSDLQTPIADPTTAHGLTPASGGIAEIRLAKDNSGVVSKPALLLRDMGISWDGRNERPQIIETFQPTYGRVEFDAAGRITNVPLPSSSDLSFYDFADKGIAGTQANYANNRYFPRSTPSRCDAGTPADRCPTTETNGMQYHRGNWSSGGRTPDWSSAGRLHGDGDVHAGDGKPDAQGKPTWLDGGDGLGVPFPGSKGYRMFSNWSFQYSNLGTWETQDTVHIVEWMPGAVEHSKNRRGMVAFGDVTNPTNVPATGSATYSGIAYGWHTGNASQDPSVFWGAATVAVNFVTREVVVTVENTVSYDSAGNPVPVASFKANTKMGAAGQSVANYLTGPVDNGTVSGGVSGRYFGPVADGAGGTGPAEVAGTFSLSRSANGQAILGGFIARKQ